MQTNTLRPHARTITGTTRGSLHREKILQLVRGSPGIHLRRLAFLVGLSWNTTLHHVHRLEAKGYATIRKVQGKVCVFDVSHGAVQGKTGTSLLRDARNLSVAQAVARHPGTHQRAVCAETDLAPSVVTRRLQALEDAGLVARVRDGRVTLVHPTPQLTDALSVATPLTPFEETLDPLSA